MMKDLVADLIGGDAWRPTPAEALNLGRAAAVILQDRADGPALVAPPRLPIAFMHAATMAA